MPGYTYETISKDPKKKQEILSFLNQLEKILNIDNSKMKEEEVIGDDANKVGFALNPDQKERLREVIGDMKTTLNGGTVEHTIDLDQSGETVTFTCDFDKMVDYMRGRMVGIDKRNENVFKQIKALPGADAFLEGLGMPERGTAGYHFDAVPDDQVFGGGHRGYHKRGTGEITDNNIYASAFALLELSGGGENWRDVKIDDEKLETVQHEYRTKIDALDGNLVDMFSDPEKGAKDMAPPLFGADPKALTDKINEAYFLKVASTNLKKAKEIYSRSLGKLEAGSKGEKETVNGKVYFYNQIDNAIPNIIQSTLATSKPRRFNSYIDVMKEERKYRHLYERFVKGQPMEKTVELLAKDPKKLLDAIAPPAKSRIEVLQSQIKKERDPEKKMLLAAEIMANREVAGAQLGGKGLENRPDPDQVKKRTAELAAEMKKAREINPEAVDKALARATSGHGGKMLEAYKAAKPMTYLDYMNNLNLDAPTEKKVSQLAAATMLFITDKVDAKAFAQPERIEKLADKIAKSSAFKKLMEDPETLLNAEMGFGLRITERLRQEQAVVDAERKKAQEKAALQAQQKAEKQQEPKVEAEGGPQLNVK